MSNVSSGVFSNVKKLPPNTGRIITVVIGSLILLALIGWGIFELYKATTPQPDDGTPPPVASDGTKVEKGDAATKPADAKPDAKPTKTSDTKSAKSNDAKQAKTKDAKPKDAKPKDAKQATGNANAAVQKAPKSVKPGDLRSSGIKVPPLYID